MEGGLLSGHTLRPLAHTANNKDPGDSSDFDALNLHQFDNTVTVVWID